jgi:transcription elongation factor Elf1
MRSLVCGDSNTSLPVRQSLNIVEHSFSCPHCGEQISMVLDLSVRKQTYVEDCEVCCQPIEITYTVSDEELAEFSARTLG